MSGEMKLRAVNHGEHSVTDLNIVVTIPSIYKGICSRITRIIDHQAIVPGAQIIGLVSKNHYNRFGTGGRGGWQRTADDGVVSVTRFDYTVQFTIATIHDLGPIIASTQAHCVSELSELAALRFYGFRR